jgi:hypothetical protein
MQLVISRIGLYVGNLVSASVQNWLSIFWLTNRWYN